MYVLVQVSSNYNEIIQLKRTFIKMFLKKLKMVLKFQKRLS